MRMTRTVLNDLGLAPTAGKLTNEEQKVTIENYHGGEQVNNADIYNDDEHGHRVQSIGRGVIKNGVQYFTLQAPWGEIVLGGGPYYNRPKDNDHYMVKVAAEINAPFSVEVPIQDFQTPDEDATVEHAVVSALIAARYYMVPFIGCMGGKGRTGTVLGVLVKAVLRARRPRIFGVPLGRVPDPVEYMRDRYRPEACETAAQEAYVRGFDTDLIEEIIRKI